MKAKAEERPEGAPEWMVSFADMITIMMSFFVIMFAIASGEVAKGKRNRQQQAAMDSLQNRFGPKYQPFASWGLAPGNSPIRNAGSHQKGKQPPEAADEPEGASVKPFQHKKERIRVPGHGDRIVIGGVVHFDDVSVVLSPAQQEHLQRIAAELAGKPQQVEVLGHGSSRPLPPGAASRDRWDLAYARCRRVVELLATMKIDRERMRVSVALASEAPPPAAGAAGGPAEDLRVDIYLTERIPEKPGH